MLRQRSRLFGGGPLSRAGFGWLALALLYVVAAALNVLLAVDSDQWWPVLLAAPLGVAAGACVVAALRRSRS